jgi:glycosyltransferase involved in cell wall biosynthesis
MRRSPPDVIAFIPFLGYGGAETQLALLLSKSAGIDFRFASFIDADGPLAEMFPSAFLGKRGVDGMVELLNTLTPRAVLFHHDGRPAQAVHRARHRPEHVVWARHTADGVNLIGGRWDRDITRIVSASKAIALGDPRESVIYNGVYQAEPGSSLAADIQLPRPVFGCVSRMDAGKQLHLLLEAVVGVGVGSCLLVGGGPDESRLDELAGVLGLRREGRYIRVAPTSDTQPWYAAMDLCVLPSAGEGGIPFTLLEASAVGTPCAITRVSDVAEFFQDDEHALLIGDDNLAGVLKALLRSRHFDLPTMGRRAQALVATHFSVDAMARRFFIDVLGILRPHTATL